VKAISLFYVNQTDNAAFRAELSAVVQSFHELVNVIGGRGFSQEGLSLFIELFRLFFYVFLLTEIIEVASWDQFFA